MRSLSVLNNNEPTWGEWVTPGWYPVALAKQVRRGRAMPVSLAGRDLVVFRSESGKARALDRYCAHFGASLAQGKVDGEHIACPFHGWTYDARGACVGIPNCDKIPARAKVAAHEVVERFGVLWVFAGPWRYYELPPEEDIVPGTGWRFVGAADLGTVATGVRDVIENSFDREHAFGVHGVTDINLAIPTFDTKARQTKFTFDMRLDHLGRSFHHTGTQRVYGPSLWATTMSVYEVGAAATISPLRAMSRALLNVSLRNDAGNLCDALPYPSTSLVLPQAIGPRETRVFTASYIQSDQGAVRAQLAGKMRFKFWNIGVGHDMRIWNHKIMRSEPVFGPGDGTVVRFHKYWEELTEIGRREERLVEQAVHVG
jgi:nitrite reductase/ring-hydroxylating ferredoxin subunit